MEYSELSVDQQKEILANRKRQYEAEHFNHSVNRDLLLASGSNDETTKRAVKEAENAMKVLDQAHSETVKKLNQVQAEVARKPKAK